MPKARAISMSRTNSSPGNFESMIDRPMRLAEIYVAAEHALWNTISDADLRKSLSSTEEFEVYDSLFILGIFIMCPAVLRCGLV